MKIAVLGAGAMGCLFGGYLSRHNEIWLVHHTARRVDAINQNGVRIIEAGGEQVFRPRAVTDSRGLGVMDLVIVFVKAPATETVLAHNQGLIGAGTTLLTLQNGAGHEAKLLKYADPAHVLIGSTLHNCSIVSDGVIRHSGSGRTSIGPLSGSPAAVQPIADAFTQCGFETVISENVREQIWRKLFINTSSSALTAVLQVPQGFILDNPHACALMENLVREAVAVANAEGSARFDAQTVIHEIKTVLARARGGYTSIYTDVKRGARSEVDTISGSVVAAAQQLGMDAPYHQCIVSLIHALEDRNRECEVT